MTWNVKHGVCVQAWCEMGRATAPPNEAVGDGDGDDWLGSSTQLGGSDSSTPVPPSQGPPTFRQGLHSVQELSEDAASLTGQGSFVTVVITIMITINFSYEQCHCHRHYHGRWVALYPRALLGNHNTIPWSARPMWDRVRDRSSLLTAMCYGDLLRHTHAAQRTAIDGTKALEAL